MHGNKDIILRPFLSAIFCVVVYFRNTRLKTKLLKYLKGKFRSVKVILNLMQSDIRFVFLINRPSQISNKCFKKMLRLNPDLVSEQHETLRYKKLKIPFTILTTPLLQTRWEVCSRTVTSTIAYNRYYTTDYISANDI